MQAILWRWAALSSEYSMVIRGQILCSKESIVWKYWNVNTVLKLLDCINGAVCHGSWFMTEKLVSTGVLSCYIKCVQVFISFSIHRCKYFSGDYSGYPSEHNYYFRYFFLAQASLHGHEIVQLLNYPELNFNSTSFNTEGNLRNNKSFEFQSQGQCRKHFSM